MCGEPALEYSQYCENCVDDAGQRLEEAIDYELKSAAALARRYGIIKELQ